MNYNQPSDNTHNEWITAISSIIEELTRLVNQYINENENSDTIQQYRQLLYSTTFSLIMEYIQPSQSQSQSQINQSTNQSKNPQAISIELASYLNEFKSEMFYLLSHNPKLSMLNFMFSQQFNDLYDILSTCQNQYESIEDNEKNQLNQSKKTYSDQKRKIKPLEQSQDILQLQEQVKRNRLYIDLEFQQLQEFIYLNQTLQDNPNKQKQQQKQLNQTPQSKVQQSFSDDSEYQDSPRLQIEKNRQESISTDLPYQLFSFDSSFIKDLPFSKNVSQFETINPPHQNSFNFTLTQGLHNISEIEKQEQLDSFVSCAPATSRFECHQNQNTDEISIKTRKDNNEISREKSLANKELQLLIKEKYIQNQKEILNQERQQFRNEIKEMNVYIKELEKENEELRWQMENFKENYWRQVSTIKDKQLQQKQFLKKQKQEIGHAVKDQLKNLAYKMQNN